VAVLPGGEFVVTWASYTADSTTNLGRRFAASTAPQGGEFEVNTFTTDYQFSPAVASDGLGQFVVVWDSGAFFSVGQDGDYYGIFGRRYAAGGPLDVEEFPVNTYTTEAQVLPDVAAASDGRFVVVWNSWGQDGSEYGVFGQRFKANGDPAGNEFDVNTETAYSQRHGRVAMHDDGSFMVVWQSNFQDLEGFGIFGQRFNASGDLVGDEMAINAVTADNQRNPDIAAAADGGFVVVWQSYDEDLDGYGVVARRFNSGGMPISDDFVVNETTQRNQDLPAVASFSDGSFVVAWRGENTGPAKSDIYARFYDSAGVAVTGEFEVNTTTADYQGQYKVDVAARGARFVVAWDGYSDDGVGLGIFARAYDVALFSDGFESNDTSEWSDTVPAP